MRWFNIQNGSGGSHLSTANPEWTMYPQPTPDPCECDEPASHKDNAMYAIERKLDFCEDCALSYLFDKCPLKVDDLLNVVYLPPETLTHSIWWKICRPQPGFTFSLQLQQLNPLKDVGNCFLDGTSPPEFEPALDAPIELAAGVSGNPEECNDGQGVIIMPDGGYFTGCCGAFIQVKVDEVPEPEVCKDKMNLCLQVSPAVIHYCTGD